MRSNGATAALVSTTVDSLDFKYPKSNLNDVQSICPDLAVNPDGMGFWSGTWRSPRPPTWRTATASRTKRRHSSSLVYCRGSKTAEAAAWPYASAAAPASSTTSLRGFRGRPRGAGCISRDAPCTTAWLWRWRTRGQAFPLTASSLLRRKLVSNSLSPLLNRPPPSGGRLASTSSSSSSSYLLPRRPRGCRWRGCLRTLCHRTTTRWST